MSGITLVDAHVHLYRSFDLGRVFDSAVRNFRASLPGGVADGEWEGCLCLTEDAHHDAFPALSRWKDAGWSATAQADGQSMRIQSAGSPVSLWVFAGRQIVTAERIEVLALLADPARSEPLSDGASLEDTLARVHSAGAIPVLPWAFGKWWFERGRLVSEEVHRTSLPVFLGDNGGRWRGIPGLDPHRLGAATKRPVLPGSDPLPLAGQEAHVGGYGFVLDTALDETAPVNSLRDAILSLRESPAVLGHPSGLVRFVSDQWKLRSQRLPQTASPA